MIGMIAKAVLNCRCYSRRGERLLALSGQDFVSVLKGGQPSAPTMLDRL